MDTEAEWFHQFYPPLSQPKPARSRSRRERVDVLRGRARRKEHLYHPADIIEGMGLERVDEN